MLEALRQRDFRRLFLGQTASSIGDAVALMALALYVTDIGTPTDVGLVLGAKTLPEVGLLLFGGVWADRLPRHRVMLATDIARFALHAFLAVLIFTGAVEIWHIVVIELLFGSGEAFFRPAYLGLIPQTVPEDMIQRATALSSTANMAALFAGPALGSVLVLGVGAGWAFVVDAATFLASAAFIFRLRPRQRGTEPERRSVWRELADGWAEVRSRQWLWSVVAGYALLLLVALAPYETLGATVGKEQYGGPATFGVVSSALGAGMVVGALWGSHWRPRYPIRAGSLAILPWPISILLYGLGAPLIATVPVFALTGVGIALFGVWWETALAERIPGHLLSRVSAYDYMGSAALLPLGYVISGPLGDAIGTSNVLVIGAVIGMVVSVGILCVPEVWRLSR